MKAGKIEVRRLFGCLGCSLVLAIVASPTVNAQTPAVIEAARQAEILQKQQRELLLQEQERARGSVPGVGGQDLRQPAVPSGGRDDGRCRQIDELVIDGGELLRRRVAETLAEKYVGRCLGVGDIEAILASITADYIEQGYITARAYLPAQDLVSGRLTIVVVEGEIEAYRLDGEGAGRIFVPGAFPGAAGDKLNLRDLEQGIDQLNRLASNRASMEILPGSAPGKSIVVIRNARSLPAHAYLGYDNLGSRSTGKRAYTLTATLDAPLGLNERWMFTRRDALPDDPEHNSLSNSFDFWMPAGKWSVGFNISRSTYVNVLTLASGAPMHTNGSTLTQAFTLDRLVYRDQATKINAFARLTAQDSRNYILGQLMGVSSRKLSYAELGGNAFFLVAGGVLTSQMTYAHGLRLFGALDDPQDIAQEAPRAQFSKFNLDLGFSRNFSLLGLTLGWSSQLAYQFARTPLYGSQQMLIGSTSSVRGHTRNALSGDRGYYWRNELSAPWRLALGGEMLSGRFFAGYDTGQVRSWVQGASEGRLTGRTLGLAAQWRGGNWEIYNSRGIDQPSFMLKEPSQTWFRVSYAF